MNAEYVKTGVEAAKEWEGHHYRGHGSHDIADCDRPLCKLAVKVLTDALKERVS